MGLKKEKKLPTVSALEDASANGLIKGLVAPNGSNLLANLLADGSLLFLSPNNDVINNALIIVDEFVDASISKCNVEKSKLLLLEIFNPTSWGGDVITQGNCQGT